MYLRNIAVGLSALVLLSTAVDARSLTNPYTSTQQRASFEGCAELFPAQTPINTATVPATMKPLALCSDTFAVLYSQTSKTPLVVVVRLNAAQLKDAKGEERTNQFYPDPRIPKAGRAELSDYRSQHPAMDRGHQAPAADAPPSKWELRLLGLYRKNDEGQEVVYRFARSLAASEFFDVQNITERLGDYCKAEVGVGEDRYAYKFEIRVPLKAPMKFKK